MASKQNISGDWREAVISNATVSVPHGERELVGVDVVTVGIVEELEQSHKVETREVVEEFGVWFCEVLQQIEKDRVIVRQLVGDGKIVVPEWVDKSHMPVQPEEEMDFGSGIKRYVDLFYKEKRQ